MYIDLLGKYERNNILRWFSTLENRKNGHIIQYICK